MREEMQMEMARIVETHAGQGLKPSDVLNAIQDVSVIVMLHTDDPRGFLSSVTKFYMDLEENPSFDECAEHLRELAKNSTKGYNID